MGKSYHGGLLAAGVVCLATGIAFSKRRETRQQEAKQAAKSTYVHSPNEAPKRCQTPLRVPDCMLVHTVTIPQGLPAVGNILVMQGFVQEPRVQQERTPCPLC